MKYDAWTEFLAGLTVFFTMAYAPFVNALVLGGPAVGMPEAPVFYATCLAAAIGSAFCGLYARTPTALAPGMAFNAFIAQYIQNSTLTWPEALAICFIVGAALLMMSLSGFRRNVIDAIPFEIKIAVVGGIGALLAQLGIDIAFPAGGEHSSQQINLFIVGVITILFLNVTLRSYAKKLQIQGKVQRARVLDLTGRSGLLISVIAVAIAYHSLGMGTTTVEPDSCIWIWACDVEKLQSVRDVNDNILTAIPFAIFILYMLFADIAGSPYHLLPKQDAERDQKISRSFVVDSTMNFIAPVLGTSPVVFYAENNAGKMLEAKTGATAMWVAVCFLILACVGFIFSYLGQPLFDLIPRIAVAPALFAVGLFVIASSLGGEELLSEQELISDQRPTEFLLPAAVSIILTPIGLEYGLAGGILAYYVYFVLVPKEVQPHKYAINPRLHIFAFVAFFAILVKLAIL